MGIKEQIRNILLLGDGDSFDDAYNIYDLIIRTENEDEQIDLFQYVCENYGLEESNESLEINRAPYKEEKSKLKEKYGTILNSVLETYLKENLEKKMFYSKIWKTVKDSYLFDSEAAKVFAVYFILIDKRIPYFELDSNCRYQLSNEKFRKLWNKYEIQLLKIRFILSTEFSQRTEQASTLLNEFGISKPNSDATREEVDEYERKLMMMVEIVAEEKSDIVLQLLRKYHER